MLGVSNDVYERLCEQLTVYHRPVKASILISHYLNSTIGFRISYSLAALVKILILALVKILILALVKILILVLVKILILVLGKIIILNCTFIRCEEGFN